MEFIKVPSGGTRPIFTASQFSTIIENKEREIDNLKTQLVTLRIANSTLRDEKKALEDQKHALEDRKTALERQKTVLEDRIREQSAHDRQDRAMNSESQVRTSMKTLETALSTLHLSQQTCQHDLMVRDVSWERTGIIIKMQALFPSDRLPVGGVIEVMVARGETLSRIMQDFAQRANVRFHYLQFWYLQWVVTPDLVVEQAGQCISANSERLS